ncbi:tax1-binding protein 1 homolog B-like [Ptychodera flava]|uniref:tax1-binding protein 1 homolog B-like n=1 Tax=Ptychodera flava TaxID=63121 RepID=UPI00396A5768
MAGPSPVTSSSSSDISDCETINSSAELVKFNDVHRIYLPNEDIFVSYTVGNKITQSSRDWIAIYPVNWSSEKDYVTFQWVTKVTDEDPKCQTHNVLFPSRTLTSIKSSCDQYRFVYVTKDSDILGASDSFVFNDDSEKVEDHHGSNDVTQDTDKCRLRIVETGSNSDRFDLFDFIDDHFNPPRNQHKSPSDSEDDVTQLSDDATAQSFKIDFRPDKRSSSTFGARRRKRKNKKLRRDMKGKTRSVTPYDRKKQTPVHHVDKETLKFEDKDENNLRSSYVIGRVNLLLEDHHSNNERALLPYNPNPLFTPCRTPPAVKSGNTTHPIAAVDNSTEPMEGIITTILKRLTSPKVEDEENFNERLATLIESTSFPTPRLSLPTVTWYGPLERSILEQEHRFIRTNYQMQCLQREKKELEVQVQQLEADLTSKNILTEELIKQIKSLISENGALCHLSEKLGNVESRLHLTFLANQKLEDEKKSMLNEKAALEERVCKVTNELRERPTIDELEKIKKEHMNTEMQNQELIKEHGKMKDRNEELEKYMDGIMYTLASEGYTHVQDVDGKEIELSAFEDKMRKGSLIRATKSGQNVDSKIRTDCLQRSGLPGLRRVQMLNISAAVSNLQSENQHLQRILNDACEREKFLNNALAARERQLVELQGEITKLISMLNDAMAKEKQMNNDLESEKQQHSSLERSNSARIRELQEKVINQQDIIDNLTSQLSPAKFEVVSENKNYQSRDQPNQWKGSGNFRHHGNYQSKVYTASSQRRPFPGGAHRMKTSPRSQTVRSPATLAGLAGTALDESRGGNAKNAPAANDTNSSSFATNSNNSTNKIDWAEMSETVTESRPRHSKRRSMMARL